MNYTTDRHEDRREAAAAVDIFGERLERAVDDHLEDAYAARHVDRGLSELIDILGYHGLLDNADTGDDSPVAAEITDLLIGLVDRTVIATRRAYAEGIVDIELEDRRDAAATTPAGQAAWAIGRLNDTT